MAIKPNGRVQSTDASRALSPTVPFSPAPLPPAKRGDYFILNEDLLRTQINKLGHMCPLAKIILAQFRDKPFLKHWSPPEILQKCPEIIWPSGALGPITTHAAVNELLSSRRAWSRRRPARARQNHQASRPSADDRPASFH